MRSDTRRNRKYLIEAAARLYAETDGPVSMSDVAREAEVSPATAYRHFTSVEDILGQFRFDVGDRLREFSARQDTQGVQLLRVVSREWVRLITKYGAAMVHTRSSEGYLKRLRQGATYLTIQAEALERPLREAVAELGLPEIGDEALFLWNIFFDPREIFDLLETVRLRQGEVSRRLSAALEAALAGWARAATDQQATDLAS